MNVGLSPSDICGFNANRHLERSRRTALYSILAMVLCVPASCTRNGSTPPTLLIETSRYEISADRTHETALDLADAKKLLVSATQEGIDIELTIETPARDMLSVDSPTERDGPETLYIDAHMPGTYQIRVSSRDHHRVSGRSRLTVHELHDITRDDRVRLNAERAMSEGGRLSLAAISTGESSRTEELRRKAAASYSTSAAAWAQLVRPIPQALALYRAARLHNDLYEWRPAAQSAGRAAELLHEDHEERLRARMLHLQGQALLETGIEADLSLAAEVLAEALAIQRGGDHVSDAAVTINTLGILAFQRGNLLDARNRFLEAGRMLEAVADEREAAKTYNNVAKIDEKRGEFLLALKFYEKAVQQAQSGHYAEELAWFLENLADAHAALGNMEKALLRYHRAAEISREAGDRLGEARAFDGMGVVYYRLGNWPSAVEYLERALAMQTGAIEIRPLVETHIHLGNAYRNSGRHAEAVDAHETALAMTGRHAEQALAHLELGRDQVAAGNRSAASLHFEKALDLAVESETPLVQAYALTERGILLAMGAPETGMAELSEALSVHRNRSFEHGEAQTLVALAKAEQQAGQPEKALAHARDALDVVEKLRRRIGQPKLKYTFTGLQWPTYDLVIELLMHLHTRASIKPPANIPDYSAMALEVSERAHAATLVELMYDAGRGKAETAGQDLRGRHREIRQKLAQTSYDRDRELMSSVSSPEVNGFEQSVVTLTAELDVIEAKIRALNPGSESLAAPKRTKVSDIQSLLDGDEQERGTLLLEYSLGETHGVLWAVTADTVESWMLPGRQVVEETARRVYAEMSSPPFRGGDKTPEAADNLRRLSDMLLAPLAAKLNGRRIVIVPDGMLHYVPFGALIVPGSNEHLLERAEVVTLPAAAVLVAQRSTLQNRKQPSRDVVVVADPVFDRRDPRLASNAAREASAERTGSMQSLLRGGGEGTLPRLPYTALEAAAIVEAVGNGGDVVTLTGFDASRARVLATPLNDFRIVHFASHGLIDTRQPELSAIALSAFDDSGDRLPALLQLDDVYELRLNADFVVLSACDTALGAEVRGEGLIGLTHAFMYAGAQGVVATLWPVEDKATLRLMEVFYEKLLEEKLSPPAALRSARLALATEETWRDPYFWAPFIYQGEWDFRSDEIHRPVTAGNK